MSKYPAYWMTDPWAYELHVEEKRWKEECQEEFNRWLDSLPPWYKELDQDTQQIQEWERWPQDK